MPYVQSSLFHKVNMNVLVQVMINNKKIFTCFIKQHQSSLICSLFMGN